MGRTVVITGAAGGLGAAIARRFSDQEGTQLVLSDIDPRALATLDEELKPALLVRTDVSEPASMNELIASAAERCGTVDVMINNAGILTQSARIHNVTADDWHRAIQVNLVGTANGISAAVRVMRARGNGVIINTASAAGLTVWPYAAPYATTKAGVIHLTRTAAAEYAKDGIRVNCVCPGTFRSAIHDGLTAEALEEIAQRHPLGLGTADDVAGAFVFLASDDARWITGTTLVVDGGYSTR